MLGIVPDPAISNEVAPRSVAPNGLAPLVATPPSGVPEGFTPPWGVAPEAAAPNVSATSDGFVQPWGIVPATAGPNVSSSGSLPSEGFAQLLGFVPEGSSEIAPAQGPAPRDGLGLLGIADGFSPLLGVTPAAAAAEASAHGNGFSELFGIEPEPGGRAVPATASGELPSRRELHARRGLRPELPQRGVLGILALVLGLAAFAVSVVQPLALAAFVPAVAAIVLGIIGVTRGVTLKALATAGLVVAALALPIAGFSYAAGVQPVEHDSPALAGGLASSASPSASVSATPSAEPSSAPSTPAAPPAPVAPTDARLGGTTKDARGISFTLQAVNCGLTTAGVAADAPTGGPFCEIRFSAVNRTGTAVTLTDADVTVIRGDGVFSVVASDFAGASSADLGPGMSVQASVYVEVPSGGRPEFVVLGDAGSFML